MASHRYLYRGVQGRVRANIGDPRIHQNSAIVMTAAEYRLEGGVFGLAGRPLLGAANVYITNIGPHDPEGGPDGGVEFFIQVDWPSPLDVIVTYTVLEDIEGFDLA
jgi:hypothetical protein